MSLTSRELSDINAKLDKVAGILRPHQVSMERLEDAKRLLLWTIDVLDKTAEFDGEGQPISERDREMASLGEGITLWLDGGRG